MSDKGVALLVTLSLAITPNGHTAGDVEDGMRKAAMCVSCHGADGVSEHDGWPSLVRLDKDYIVSQLKAYRDRARISEWMNPVAQMLSDKDIEDLAAWFSQRRLQGSWQ